MSSDHWPADPGDRFSIRQGTRPVCMSLEDYDRARACVNALADLNPDGVEDALAALRKLTFNRGREVRDLARGARDGLENA
jgi:hypothetical protein